ncbi:reverse transcriptase domain-containing protein [Thiohalophilus thiocyanatoxydans]|uniref:RNA-directed DNA polymerase n=1 Tax=Thiohalophilus thiocyanatoxydans TaxID=381308 RepID=A0A4R8IH66_9GAMM|nr:reverse transcriptase domain-containing protein [Thiohalophilus thiocyanatoxydans]TDX99557.1 RNA-directed DNA polymerase [Thiohalophilus thiocyanatoxydans]
MKDAFLNIKTHQELAKYFGLSYADLSKIIYKTDFEYKYHHFVIPKKSGGERHINAPSKKLKLIQITLKDVLYDIYPTKPAAHGFVKNKSIVTNAEKHLDKRYIFNIDIENFFGEIHFGRVRNLFKSSPFNFNNTVATILAQICCFENALPQGAPTSPIISNMIAWKLDSQLQQLAKITNCTYTRYADDISFSFTCNKNRLPEEIVSVSEGDARPGRTLTGIIEDNGFRINYSKVRLRGKYSRMEVTGLTVNEFINVKRKFIRQLSSMLHAWRKFGYDKAEEEYNNKYNRKHRASGKETSYLHVVKGKLAFLNNIRSKRDPVYIKYAKQFNELVGNEHKFIIVEITEPEQNAINSIWVVEACYDYNDEVRVSQGTGFHLSDVGIITCAHVVSNDDGEIYEEIEVFKYSETTKRYTIKVDRICRHRDIAICSLVVDEDENPPNNELQKSQSIPYIQQQVKLLGFPGYAPGHSYSIVDANITMTFVESGVNKVEINQLIRSGDSGGPIVDADSNVIGMAQKGVDEKYKRNSCVVLQEIEAVYNSDGYKTE